MPQADSSDAEAESGKAQASSERVASSEVWLEPIKGTRGKGGDMGGEAWIICASGDKVLFALLPWVVAQAMGPRGFAPHDERAKRLLASVPILSAAELARHPARALTAVLHVIDANRELFSPVQPLTWQRPI